jgi:hypothetical protein
MGLTHKSRFTSSQGRQYDWNIEVQVVTMNGTQMW